MTVAERLVLKRQRHLKWRALDPLETALMMLCGLLLFGFCSTVILDIVTREIGRPWLWLQEVTSTFFIYAIFTGTAVASRRNDHLYLTAIGDNLHGRTRHKRSTWAAAFGSRLAATCEHCGPTDGLDVVLHFPWMFTRK